MPTLSTSWEYFGDFADATRRFTAGADLPTIALTTLLDDLVPIAASATVTVWDSATSPLPNFDFLYVQAIDEPLLVEVTGTVDAMPQTQVFMLTAASLPFQLTDDTFYATLGGDAGLVTKVRVSNTTTSAATARVGVGRA